LFVFILVASVCQYFIFAKNREDGRPKYL